MGGFTLPEIVVQPTEELLPGAATGIPAATDIAAGGADVAGAFDAAGGGAAGLLGGMGLASLVNLFDPSFFGGDPGLSPSQVAASNAAQAAAAGFGTGPGAIQAWINSLFTSQGLPTRFSPITQAQAGGLTPSTVVGQEFAQLPPLTSGPQAAPVSALPNVRAALTPTAPTNIAGTARPGTGVGPAAAPSTVADPRDVAAAASAAGPSGTTDPNALPSGAGRALYSGGQFQGIEGVAPAAATDTAGAGGIGSFFKNNAGLLGLLGLGVGGQFLSGPISNALGLNKVPGSQNLTNVAQQEGGVAGSQAAIGTQLQQPLATGTLPAPQQAAVDQALNDAIGTIKGKYASLGMSGSTSEMSAIDAAKQEAEVSKAKIEAELFTAGTGAVNTATTALGLEGQIYQDLLNASLGQDKQLAQSISSFANALALGTAIKGIPGVTTAA